MLQATEAAFLSAGSDERALLQYGPSHGGGDIVRHICTYVNDPSVDPSRMTPLSPSRVLATPGNSLAIHEALSVLTKPGDRVLVADPTYFLSLSILEQLGVHAIPCRSDEYGLCVDPPENEYENVHGGDLDLSFSLEQLMQHHKPTAMYVIPSFCNPTGTVLPLSRRLRLLELAEKYNVSIVSDEAYHHLPFSFDSHDANVTSSSSSQSFYFDSFSSSLRGVTSTKATSTAATALPPSMADLAASIEQKQKQKRAQVLSLFTFSKALAPGFRLGWMEASDEDLLHRCLSRGWVVSGGAASCFASGVVSQMIQVQYEYECGTCILTLSCTYCKTVVH